MQFIAEITSNSYLALRQQFNTSDLPLFWLDREPQLFQCDRCRQLEPDRLV